MMHQVCRTSGVNILDALATRPWAKFAEVKLRHTYEGARRNTNQGGEGGVGTKSKASDNTAHTIYLFIFYKC